MSVHYSSCILQTMSQFVEVIGIKFMCHTLIKKRKKVYVLCIYVYFFPIFTNYDSIRLLLSLSKISRFVFYLAFFFFFHLYILIFLFQLYYFTNMLLLNRPTFSTIKNAWYYNGLIKFSLIFSLT